MDEVVQRAGERGVQEIVIGMAHRGRLNVLVNTLGKMPKDLFAEFDHTAPEDLPSGDVKYHQGFSSDVTTPGGPVHLSLAFNPSHLEIVNPVVEGSVKARMDRRGDKEGDQVLPVLVHGDAAFAGQGVVMETLALAQTRGYYTGGTVHLVINNQIGFTTSDPRDSRSTLYCTDVVKMIEAPVLHVNGDDPEAVVLCTQLALDYRQQFNKDVVVDIICFRKLGHNEQDTPSLTQPLMYKKIAKHPGTRKLYGDKLVAQGVLPADGPDKMVKELARRARRRQAHRRPGADQLQEQVRGRLGAVPRQPQVDRRGRHRAAAGRDQAPGRAHHHGAGQLQGAPAGREGAGRPRRDGPRRDQRRLGHGRAPGLSPRWWPAAMRCACRARTAAAAPSRTATRCCTTRTARSGTPAPTCRCSTWPTTRRRSSSSTRCCPKKRCWASSTATPSAEPNTLVIWEAQFGDFVNGAQVVIDQFIASGEVKWGRVNGLTLMLPHGYEGQGPEHSSARLERFMQLAADNNMQIVQPTSASQIFHLLRRQMVRQFRKPLIILTPKSLLRAKDADLAAVGVHQGRVPHRHRRQPARGRAPTRSSASSPARARWPTTCCAAATRRRPGTWPSCASSSSTRSRTRPSAPS